MFDKTENYFVATSDTNAILTAVQQALVQRGLGGVQSLGNGLTALAPPAGNSVTPRVTAMAFPAQGGLQVRLHVKGEVDSNGTTMMIIMLLFFWPVALYLWYMANQSFTSASTDLMNVMRYAISPYLANGGMPGQYPQGPTQPGY